MQFFSAVSQLFGSHLCQVCEASRCDVMEGLAVMWVGVGMQGHPGLSYYHCPHHLTILLSLPPPFYFPTIIAPTILLSCYHCPNYLTILLSLLLSSYFPTIIAPHHLTMLLPMLLSSLPWVKSIFHWAESHRSSQLNSSQWHSNAILKIDCRRLISFCLKDIILY